MLLVIDGVNWTGEPVLDALLFLGGILVFTGLFFAALGAINK